MAGMYFEDFEPDLSMETPARTITETDIVLFAGLSGDYNPLHTDETFAQGTPFGGRVAHGLLSVSIATGLIYATGVTAGTALALGEITWRFLAPVRAGDTLRARLTVLERRASSKPDRGVVVRRCELLNQRGEAVSEGRLTTIIKRRSHD